MTVKIDTDARIERIILQDATGTFSGNPSAGYSWFYTITGSAHGGLFLEKATGEIIGPFITGTASASGGIEWQITFKPRDNEPPSGSYATLDERNIHPVLDFSPTTDEAAVFTSVMHHDYNGPTGTSVAIHYSMETATTGTIVWQAAWERIGEGQQDIDTDGFAAFNSISGVVPSTSGHVDVLLVQFTDGADMDNVSAGELFRLKIQRDADNASDSAPGDAELHAVVLRET